MAFPTTQDGGPARGCHERHGWMPSGLRPEPSAGTVHHVILRGTRADGGRSRGPRKLPRAPRAVPRRHGAAARGLHVGNCESGRESGATISPLSQQRPPLQCQKISPLRQQRPPFHVPHSPHSSRRRTSTPVLMSSLMFRCVIRDSLPLVSPIPT